MNFHASNMEGYLAQPVALPPTLPQPQQPYYPTQAVIICPA